MYIAIGSRHRATTNSKTPPINPKSAVLQHSVEDQGHPGVMRKAGRVGDAPEIGPRLTSLAESGRLALGNDLTWWV